MSKVRQKTIWLWMIILIAIAGLAQDQNREDPLARFKTETDTYLELWRKGQYAESLKFLEGAIIGSSDGVPMRWLYDRAELMFELGRVDDAIQEIEWLHYRRPSPKSALQLALYHQTRGNLNEFRNTLEAASSRYKRFRGDKDDTENTISIIRIRELLGENPRSLFQELVTIEDNDVEDKVAIQLAAGNLAWRKFDYALAASHYEKALELDPESLEAQAGLAECYWKSNDPRLDDTMNGVLEVNPIHPRVIAIKVEQLLDLAKADEAITEIEKILVVNPNQLRFLGLKAAAMFLRDDLANMHMALQRALMFNEHASQVYRILGRVASRHYRFEEGASFQGSALEVNPDDHLARAFLAFDLLRLGREKEGRAQLERSFEKDRFNVTVYNMLELLDTLAKFEVIEKGPFRIRMPARERMVWGDEVVTFLEDAYTHFQKEYDIQLETPIHVQIFDNHDDFMVRSVGLPGAVGYLGICFGKLVTMDAPSARNKGSMNWRATLWHEFVHVVTLQKTRNRMPRWLSEGISVYEETRREPAWGQRPDPSYKGVVAAGDVPGLDDLELFFTQPKSAMHIPFGYYIAGEFVGFYARTYGQDALVRALAAIGQGDNTVEALVAASGTDRKSVDNAMGAFFEKLLAPYDHLPDPNPNLLEKITGQKMSGGGITGTAPFVNAVEKANAAMGKEDWDDAIHWLKEADALFPGMTGPGSPLNMLADLYSKLNRVEEELEVRHKLFALDGNDWQTCHALVEAYRETGNWQAMQRTAQRGLSIDPFDIPMHRANKEALVKTASYRGALKSLATLILLDGDRATDYRMERIDLHIERKQWRSARSETLELLEEVPYSWQAQQRLLRIAEQNVGAGGN